MTKAPMSRNTLPDIDILRQIFRYDPETGDLYYADRSNEMFTSNRAANSWRSQFLGQRANCVVCKEDRQYIQVQLFGRKYLAHRIIWKLHHGTEPPEILDHVDGNGINNRIENLRPATIFQNGWNTKLSSRNKSGHKGVSYVARKNKWKASIRVEKRDILIGHFGTVEEAAEAYSKAAASYHGEFYNPT